MRSRQHIALILASGLRADTTLAPDWSVDGFVDGTRAVYFADVSPLVSPR